MNNNYNVHMNLKQLIIQLILIFSCSGFFLIVEAKNYKVLHSWSRISGLGDKMGECFRDLETKVDQAIDAGYILQAGINVATTEKYFYCSQAVARMKKLPTYTQIKFNIDLLQPLAMGITPVPEDDLTGFPAVIANVHPTGQAKEAGIEAGMYIHKINGFDVRDKTYEWVTEVLKEAKMQAKKKNQNRITKMVMICALAVEATTDLTDDL